MEDDCCFLARPLMTENSPNSIVSAENSGDIDVKDTALLDVPAEERVVLLTEAGLVDLNRLKRFRVRGGDRFRWLSGMVTNMVQDLGANEGAWNLVLNSQGRIQGDLEVWRGEVGAVSQSVSADELEIQIESAQVERLMAHLDKYIIMDDVELIPVEDVGAIGVFGPMAEKVLGAIGIAGFEKTLTQKLVAWNGREVLVRRAFSTIVPRYELWIESGSQDELRKALSAAGSQSGKAGPVGFAAAEMLRIVEGIPRYGVEMVERDLPQESSQMRALHFSKGCYQGQEIVERIHSRANVHRHLRQVEFLDAVPVAGSTLKWKDAEAGVVRSAVKVGERCFGFAMVRSEAEASDAVLEFDGGENEIGEAHLLSGPPTLNELV